MSIDQHPLQFAASTRERSRSFNLCCQRTRIDALDSVALVLKQKCEGSGMQLITMSFCPCFLLMLRDRSWVEAANRMGRQTYRHGPPGGGQKGSRLRGGLLAEG
jgi:hypothetical protein